MRAAALCLLAVFTAVPAAGQAAAGQVFEPFTRAPDVRLPLELAREAHREFVAVEVPAARTRTEGSVSILVIPALFDDSPEPAVAADELAATLFGTTGRTLTTFYQEMSDGRLDVSGAVPDWVRTSVTVLDAAGNVDGHGFIGDSAGTHFAAAIAAVDSVVDFTRYDNDGPDGVPDSGDDDGYVDAVTFKFTEVAGSCGGSGFWPHRSSLRDSTGAWGVPTADTAASGEPVRVLGYTTESVVECDGVTPQGPSVMAHEFGHVLGLPDFYRAVEGIEATQRHWMVGCFGLMAAGSWGCGSETRVQGYGPSGLSPLSRWMLGWGDATTVEEVEDTTYVLEPAQTSGQYLKIRLAPYWEEYLLVEYRPRLGFDDALPAGGVLAYHVNVRADIYGGAYAPGFPYWLLEADGDGALRRTLPDGGDRGVAGDVFGRAGAVDSLTPATSPSTRLANGSGSNVWIRSIGVVDGSARIRLTTVTALSGTGILTPAVASALEPFEVNYDLHGGVPPYSAVPPPDGLPIDGLTATMDGHRIVVRGTPLVAGDTVILPLHARDSAGDSWWLGHALELADPALTDPELLDPLVAPAAGNQDVRDYLDRSGNGNEEYDIGDLRAYVQRTGG